MPKKMQTPPRYIKTRGQPIDVSPTLTACETIDENDIESNMLNVKSSQHQAIKDNNDSKVTIEHLVESRSSSRSLIMGMTKPMFAIVTALILATSGSTAFFMTEGWFKIPGLQNQISELQNEVFRLENQVSRLENQVDQLSIEVKNLAKENERFSMLNQQLNATADEYQQLNNRLSESTVHLENITEILNTTNVALESSVQELAKQNTFYATITQALNMTNIELVEINSDLRAVTSFLNESASVMKQSFEDIANYLAEEISINRNLVLEMMQNTYQQRISTWDCDFMDRFRGEMFLYNGYIPIGNENKTHELIDYVNERVLSHLCLSQSDFTSYLDETYELEKLSSNQFIRGVSAYTAAALGYYFPKTATNNGLSQNDWISASFSCELLIMPFSYRHSL